MTNREAWALMEADHARLRRELADTIAAERAALLRATDARCDSHPQRRAVRRIRDAGNTIHLCCAQCLRELRCA